MRTMRLTWFSALNKYDYRLECQLHLLVDIDAAKSENPLELKLDSSI